MNDKNNDFDAAPTASAPSGESIEARTERIRLSHENADSKGKIQLRHEVECLLAHIALLKSEQRAPAIGQQADRDEDESAENSWRRLALQFDGHRMQALAHIRALLADYAKHAPVASEFLSLPPLSGEAVLVQRISAISHLSATNSGTESVDTDDCAAFSDAVLFGTEPAPQAAPDDLLGLLREFVSYTSDSAGMSVDIVQNEAKFAAFMDELRRRHDSLISRATAAIAQRGAA